MTRKFATTLIAAAVLLGIGAGWSVARIGRDPGRAPTRLSAPRVVGTAAPMPWTARGMLVYLSPASCENASAILHAPEAAQVTQSVADARHPANRSVTLRFSTEAQASAFLRASYAAFSGCQGPAGYTSVKRLPNLITAVRQDAAGQSGLDVAVQVNSNDSPGHNVVTLTITPLHR